MFIHAAVSLKISFRLPLPAQSVLVAASSPAPTLSLLHKHTGSALSPAAVFPLALFLEPAEWCWALLPLPLQQQLHHCAADDEILTIWDCQLDSHKTFLQIICMWNWKRVLLPPIGSHIVLWARPRTHHKLLRKTHELNPESLCFWGCANFLSCPFTAPRPHFATSWGRWLSNSKIAQVPVAASSFLWPSNRDAEVAILTPLCSNPFPLPFKKKEVRVSAALPHCRPGSGAGNRAGGLWSHSPLSQTYTHLFESQWR